MCVSCLNSHMGGQCTLIGGLLLSTWGPLCIVPWQPETFPPRSRLHVHAPGAESGLKDQNEHFDEREITLNMKRSCERGMRKTALNPLIVQ